MALQAITIDPRFYHRARRDVDFIKRYIFPGANIPSVPVLREAAERTAGLRAACTSRTSRRITPRR